jgi:hypothetical protein
MSIVDDPIVEGEKNCKTTDLVGGFPPSTNHKLGTRLYVYDAVTKELKTIFKLVDVGDGLVWMRLGAL